MIRIRTVLILGAGASAPYGFPTGQRLKDYICQGGNSFLYQHCGFQRDFYEAFITALKRAGCSSVDTFLESRPEYLDIGKAAIAAYMLPYESTVRLFDMWIDIRLKPDRAKEYQNNWPWYEHLFGILTEGVAFSELGQNKLSVVTFNYDRSFEYFLMTALQNRYGKPEPECADVINGSTEIVHVHGSLGKLPWQTGADPRKNVVEYEVGSIDDGAKARRIRRAAENITVLHEGRDDSPDFQRARELIQQADQVLFLGFGYHPVNLRRLGIGGAVVLPLRTWGTAIGLDKEHRERFITAGRKQREGSQSSDRDNMLKDADAYALLRDYVTFSS